ncbi:MAG TPA: hypothetical protein DEP84_21860 [Chloroflexi bacterium]|nr:hypothetical protein [Chloroflexota bacterium]
MLVRQGQTEWNRGERLRGPGLGTETLWRVRQDSGTINVIEADHGEFTIGLLNDTCHRRSRSG